MTTTPTRTMDPSEPYSPAAPAGTAAPADPITGLPLTGSSWKEFMALMVILLGTVTVALSLLLTFVVCFPQPGGGTPMTEDVIAGREKYMQSCSVCHGTRGEGKTGLGLPFTSSEFVKQQSDAQLVAFIKKGRPVDDPANTTKVAMPPSGGNPALTDQDLSGIVSFIRRLSS